MNRLAVWRLGMQCLGGPLVLVPAVALAAGQLLSLLLITQVFQDTFASAWSGSTLWRVFGIGVLGIIGSAGIYLSRRLSARIANDGARRLRIRLLDLLQNGAQAYFVKSNAGSLHAIIVWDSERVQKFLEALLGQMLPAIVVGGGALAALLWLNPMLMLILGCALPILLLFNRFSLEALKRQIDKRARALQAYSRATLAFLQMTNLTRLQTAEAQETANQTERIDALKRETEAFSNQQALHLSIQNALLLSVTGILLVIGGTQVVAGQTTLGNLLAFNAILLALRRYSQDALVTLPVLTDGYQALESLQQLIDRVPPEPYTGTVRHQLGGTIAFRGVTFGYRDDSPILRGVNLTLAPHTLTALHGANGSGKTTLVNLLLGLYRPQEGCVTADDLSYEELDMRHLRRQMGVLPQDPFLLDGTIWENITYGMPEATQQKVAAAAEMAAADELIRELPEGYDTLVGERGVRLSGGQRQRIALARVLLRQPAVLVLDEPTNHLDVDATRHLVDYIMHRESPPTTLVITHDVALAREMDHVYWLREGRLAAAESSSASVNALRHDA